MQVSVLISLLRFVLASSSDWKERRLGGRTIGNLFKFREVPPERLRHFHLRSLQNTDELQSVDHRLALKMIVGNHKRLSCPLRDFSDARYPGSEFFGGVKIVVALMGGDRFVVAKPRVVAPPVKSNVPDSRSGLGGRAKRPSYDGLVDVAKTDSAALQQFQSFR